MNYLLLLLVETKYTISNLKALLMAGTPLHMVGVSNWKSNLIIILYSYNINRYTYLNFISPSVSISLVNVPLCSFYPFEINLVFTLLQQNKILIPVVKSTSTFKLPQFQYAQICFLTVRILPYLISEIYMVESCCIHMNSMMYIFQSG